MKLSDSSDPILRGRLREAPFKPNFRVVLVEPEIPQNTGNVGRTCVGTCSELHLVGKMGFDITDKNLKRAGLDYWPNLSWRHHLTEDEWVSGIDNPDRVFYFSTKATKTLWDVDFRQGDWFVFGKESQGLREEVLRQNMDRALRIPIRGPVRSFNVATAAALVVFEGMRQLDKRGELLKDPRLP